VNTVHADLLDVSVRGSVALSRGVCSLWI